MLSDAVWTVPKHILSDDAQTVWVLAFVRDWNKEWQCHLSASGERGDLCGSESFQCLKCTGSVGYREWLLAGIFGTFLVTCLFHSAVRLEANFLTHFLGMQKQKESKDLYCCSHLVL